MESWYVQVVRSGVTFVLRTRSPVETRSKTWGNTRSGEEWVSIVHVSGEPALEVPTGRGGVRRSIRGG